VVAECDPPDLPCDVVEAFLPLDDLPCGWLDLPCVVVFECDLPDFPCEPAVALWDFDFDFPFALLAVLVTGAGGHGPSVSPWFSICAGTAFGLTVIVTNGLVFEWV
jgi:hypothetical protein